MLKMYINGTPGGTDGTEVTTLTFKNMLSYMRGYSAPSGYNSVIYLPIFLREEPGFTATDVKIKNLSVTNAIVAVGQPKKTWPTTTSGAGVIYNTVGYVMDVGSRVGAIAQTNILIYFGIAASVNIPSGTQLFSISYVESAT